VTSSTSSLSPAASIAAKKATMPSFRSVSNSACSFSWLACVSNPDALTTTIRVPASAASSCTATANPSAIVAPPSRAGSSSLVALVPVITAKSSTASTDRP